MIGIGRKEQRNGQFMKLYSEKSWPRVFKTEEKSYPQIQETQENYTQDGQNTYLAVSQQNG